MIPVVGGNKSCVLLRHQNLYTALPENLKFVYCSHLLDHKG